MMLKIKQTALNLDGLCRRFILGLLRNLLRNRSISNKLFSRRWLGNYATRYGLLLGHTGDLCKSRLDLLGIRLLSQKESQLVLIQMEIRCYGSAHGGILSHYDRKIRYDILVSPCLRAMEEHGYLHLQG